MTPGRKDHGVTRENSGDLLMIVLCLTYLIRKRKKVVNDVWARLQSY